MSFAKIVTKLTAVILTGLFAIQSLAAQTTSADQTDTDPVDTDQIDPTIATPLFMDSDILEVRFEGPIKTIVKNAARLTDPHEATLVVPQTSDAYDITLAARGKSRRTQGVCDFPPLRVKFAKRAEFGVFEDQKSLKLVTHCHRSTGRDYHALFEYSIYRMLNVLDEKSMRARLAKIEYVDTKTGKEVDTRWGFFIEDMDDAAERNGMKELDIAGLSPQRLDAEASARVALFQYMIGNVDFSFRGAVKGADCCHNMKLMAKNKTDLTNVVPVPYDFDQTGIVDPPEALLPEGLPIRNLRMRLYRGLCAHNDEVRKQAVLFSQHQDEMEAVLDTLPDLPERQMKRVQSFLGFFFETLSDPKRFEKRVIDKCR